MTSISTSAVDYTMYNSSVLPSEADRKLNLELSEPFPDSVIKKLKKGGASLDYIPVAEVIARLNFVLGTENWSEESSEVWIDPNYPDWALAKVTLVAYINGQHTRKIGFGGEKIKFMKADGAPLDLGDSFKGASSDAFKKAATKLGVGLDLARSEEALEYEEQEILRKIQDSLPKASPAQIEKIKAYLNAFTSEQKEETKEWWKENDIPSVTSGKITFSQAEMILEKFESVNE